MQQGCRQGAKHGFFLLRAPSAGVEAMRPFFKFLSVFTVAAAAALPSLAAAGPSGAADGKAGAMISLAAPPGRVGRVSQASGQLSFHGAGETAWSPASVNYPVAAGEGFETAAGGRGAIEIGEDRLSLAGDTEIAVARLDPHTIDIKLLRGEVGFAVARLKPGESVTIELPRGDARLLAPGNYEIAAGTPPQPSRLAVFEGQARFSGGGVDLAVKPGSAARISADKSVSAAIEAAGKAPQQIASEPALPADVGAGITGIEDLVAAGGWAVAPGFGAVWYPKGVPAGWVPYRDGHWEWIEPWGWTWIDNQPWGFAPSHYGRWAEIGGKWGWLPGAKSARPIYAPALVAFLGTAGVGISVAGGNGPAIGWFPLGPGEIYWPAYTGDLGYIRKLNAPDVANAATIRIGGNGKPPVEVVNWHFQNRLAASVVPRPVFADGRPVAVALLRLPQERLREAPAVMGSPRVTPAMLRALTAPPPKQPMVAKKKDIVRVAVVAERRITHASVAMRPHRLAGRARPTPRPELRLLHTPGAHFRVPAYARGQPKRFVIRARAVRAVPKPARPLQHLLKVGAKFQVLHVPARKKPAP
jgi:hypothetical protein